MATLQLRVDAKLKKKSDDLFQSNVHHSPEDLSLEKAISDTRKQENLGLRVFQIINDELILSATAAGTHADLFGK